jgi:hypothetical protein
VGVRCYSASLTTRVTYTTPSDFQGESGYTGTLNLRLPKRVEECDGGCAHVLRTSVTDYRVPNLDQYVSRRILGLARYQKLYDGAAEANLRSQVGYVYDETGDDGPGPDKFIAALPTPAAQHDAAVYGQPFDAATGQGLRWRGNARRARRYSVDQASGAVGGYVESRAGFNVTGTLAYTKDAEGHKTSVSYADSFYLNVNRTHTNPQQQLKTYAYPTTVTDAEGFTTSTTYNYDMDVTTKTRTPKPNVTTDQVGGPEVTRFYDAAGRALKMKNSVNGAHTEWAYDPSMTLIRSYTTVSDDSVQNPALRLYAATALDGAGRVRGTAQDFPDSTGPAPVGNYTARVTDYDAAGRAVFQSNPTEMRIVGGVWTPTGDDANSGAWKGTTRVYDWKGRPKRTVDPEGADTLFDYSACGCAGGEVVTVRGHRFRPTRRRHRGVARRRSTTTRTAAPSGRN